MPLRKSTGSTATRIFVCPVQLDHSPWLRNSTINAASSLAPTFRSSTRSAFLAVRAHDPTLTDALRECLLVFSHSISGLSSLTGEQNGGGQPCFLGAHAGQQHQWCGSPPIVVS